VYVSNHGVIIILLKCKFSERNSKEYHYFKIPRFEFRQSWSFSYTTSIVTDGRMKYMGGWMDAWFRVGPRHRNFMPVIGCVVPGHEEAWRLLHLSDRISILGGHDVIRSLRAVLVSHGPVSSSFRTHLSVQWPSLASSAHQVFIHIHVSICAT
jgi:hypothetical protein